VLCLRAHRIGLAQHATAGAADARVPACVGTCTNTPVGHCHCLQARS
jgi:hypothetical protein